MNDLPLHFRLYKWLLFIFEKKFFPGRSCRCESDAWPDSQGGRQVLKTENVNISLKY